MAGTHNAVVIEDDPDIRELVREVLEQAGFAVLTAGTGADGIALIEAHDPLVATLDLSLPGMDGFETARRIRAFSSTYIVMLTARAEEIDAVQGLQSGADDYLTKPFRPRELRARIDAMLRRPRSLSTPDPQPQPTRNPSAGVDLDWIEHKGLRLHAGMRLVTADGVALELTRSEFDILHDLLTSGRRVIGKDDLALMLRGDRLAGSTYVSEHDVRAIEVHVANLRRKLGESATRPRWIETVRGVGYRLAA